MLVLKITIKYSRKRNHFIGPAQGEQACGDIGPGRLEEPEKIIEFITKLSNKGPLSGKTITITAGPPGSR